MKITHGTSRNLHVLKMFGSIIRLTKVPSLLHTSAWRSSFSLAKSLASSDMAVDMFSVDTRANFFSVAASFCLSSASRRSKQSILLRNWFWKQFEEWQWKLKAQFEKLRHLLRSKCRTTRQHNIADPTWKWIMIFT